MGDELNREQREKQRAEKLHVYSNRCESIESALYDNIMKGLKNGIAPTAGTIEAIRMLILLHASCYSGFDAGLR